MTVATAGRSFTDRARGILDAIAGRVRGTGPRDVPTINSGAFRQYADYYRRRTSELAEQLGSGIMSIDDWEAAMRLELDRLHTTAYIVGKGGIDRLDRDDTQQIDVLVREQQQYLHRWADQMAADGVPSAAAVKARANLYLSNASVTLQTATTEALGIPALPAYPRDGSTTCLVGCKCRWEIQQTGPGAWSCFWRLGASEHCPECQRRAVVWNPLTIKGGQVVTGSIAGLFKSR